MASPKTDHLPLHSCRYNLGRRHRVPERPALLGFSVFLASHVRGWNPSLQRTSCSWPSSGSGCESKGEGMGADRSHL